MVLVSFKILGRLSQLVGFLSRIAIPRYEGLRLWPSDESTIRPPSLPSGKHLTMTRTRIACGRSVVSESSGIEIASIDSSTVSPAATVEYASLQRRRLVISAISEPRHH